MTMQTKGRKIASMKEQFKQKVEILRAMDTIVRMSVLK